MLYFFPHSIVILYLRFGAQVLQDNFVAELSTHYQNYILVLWYCSSRNVNLFSCRRCFKIVYLGLRPLTSRWPHEVESVLFEIFCQHFVMALFKDYDLDSLSLVCPHHMHHNCLWYSPRGMKSWCISMHAWCISNFNEILWQIWQYLLPQLFALYLPVDIGCTKIWEINSFDVTENAFEYWSKSACDTGHNWEFKCLGGHFFWCLLTTGLWPVFLALNHDILIHSAFWECLCDCSCSGCWLA